MSKDELKRAIQQAVQQLPQRGEINKILLFGSHLHGDATEESDIDLLIELQKPITIGLFEFARIERELAEALKKKVDLTTPDSLSKYIRDDVLAEAEVLYEK